VERVLVDGVQVDIKIVEEWGYAMGEDTCLFEEESGSEPSQDDEGVGFVEPKASQNVDLLVEKFVDVDEDDDEDLGQSGVKTPNIIVSTVATLGTVKSAVGGMKRCVAQTERWLSCP
jgi:hypothetical protein